MGIGPGGSLNHVINDIPLSTKIVGVDYNHGYVESAKKKFEMKSNVEVIELDYYDIEEIIDEKFDVILFSSSFMILPRPYDAIKIAQKMLNKDGRIYFLMTLFKEKNLFTSVLGHIKPYLKYISTVDFGRITYE